MSLIKNIRARELLDSRGIPTIEAEVVLSSGAIGCAIVPSGASTGSHEALELRDGGTRYMGKGVLKAIANIEQQIAPALVGRSAMQQIDIDQIMIGLDGTANKAKIGANAILAVSIAIAKAAAQCRQQPLYSYLHDIFDLDAPLSMPLPMMNIINGGVHADNTLSFQEFMIIPHGAQSFAEALRYGVETFYALKALLKQQGFATAVGDEGGFAPNLANSRAAIELIIAAIKQAGLQPGKDISIAIDAASNEFYVDGYYVIAEEKLRLSSTEMIDYYQRLCSDYPLISLEDGLAENDWVGWQQLTKRLGNKLQIVGDDLFVTNTTRLQTGIAEQSANAILIKMNQIGTLTETFAAIKLAQQARFATIISHRSGESEDTTIADLAVATNAGQIKTGSLSRSERISKYNRLLRIAESVNNFAMYKLPGTK